MDEAKEEPKADGKKTRAPLVGMALEMDVMKKIANQLNRLPKGSPAASRVLKFVADFVAAPAAEAKPEEDLL